MKIFYNKSGYAVSPVQIAKALNRVTELRHAGFRKGFALKLVAQEQSLTADTAKEIWDARNIWMKKSR